MDDVTKTGDAMRSELSQSLENLQSQAPGLSLEKYSADEVLDDIIETGQQLKSCQKTGMSQASVAILLCTYNGDRFLRDQLESLRKQHHENFTLHVSDDGSSDRTKHLIKQFQLGLGAGRISIRAGPESGVTRNFHSLICDPDISSDYYAYCDQDDVWEADKLSRAIELMEKTPGSGPAIYCSRTTLIDEDGKPTGLFPLFDRPPGFANALIQNIAGGNTMVLNREARDLLCEAGSQKVVHHDWWSYMLITGAGGEIIFDTYPSVRYRQHSDNCVGANNRWWERLSRLRLMLEGRFRCWNDMHINALMNVRHLLTEENLEVLDQFASTRKRWLLPRLVGVKKSGVYRQTFWGDVALVTATVLRKL